MPRLTIVHLLWFSCGLFLLGLLGSSAMSTAPGGESFQFLLMGSSATLSALCAAGAIACMRLGVTGPRWLVHSLLGVTCLATVVVMLVSVG